MAVKTLLGAARPVIAGGEDIFWSHAEDELKEFVELTNVPVITRRNGRGAVPENHPLAFSGRARGAILRSADVAMTIGLKPRLPRGLRRLGRQAQTHPDHPDPERPRIDRPDGADRHRQPEGRPQADD